MDLIWLYVVLSVLLGGIIIYFVWNYLKKSDKNEKKKVRKLVRGPASVGPGGRRRNLNTKQRRPINKASYIFLQRIITGQISTFRFLGHLIFYEYLYLRGSVHFDRYGYGLLMNLA
jgi:hypothetical protein